jgi:hypothetical protein
LIDGGFDLILLQEVRKVDLNGLRDEFDWCCHSLGPDIHSMVLGVAILGRDGVEPLATHQLAAVDFVNGEVYDDLGRWFHERHLALDVRLESGTEVRVASFHATPGTSDGPGSPKRGVGQLKPWFHTRIAQWLSTWDMPFLFAVDANSPAIDVLDWEGVRFHIPCAGTGRPGEDFLIGPPGTRLHRAEDLWRVWLNSAAGKLDRDAVPVEGPLARAHFTGGRWYRYDHLYATSDIVPVAMAYQAPDSNPETAISDHALVTATLDVRGTAQ